MGGAHSSWRSSWGQENGCGREQYPCDDSLAPWSEPEWANRPDSSVHECPGASKGPPILDHRHGGVTLLHRTHEVGEVSSRRVSKAGGKWLLPGSGDLSMQIAEKWQLPPFRLRESSECAPLRNRSSSFEARDSRGSSGQSSASFSVACESTSTSSE